MSFFSLQALVEAAQEKLDNQDGITTVHGRFYNLSSNYYKLIGDYAKYYRDALRFLGVTKLEDISGEFYWLYKERQP